MATDVESPLPEERPSTQLSPPLPPPAVTYLTSIVNSKPVEETAPWIDNAMQQALIYQKTIQGSLKTAIEASRSRLSEISSTSQAHFSQTIVSSLFHEKNWHSQMYIIYINLYAFFYFTVN